MSSSATSPRSPSTGTSTSRAAWSRSARPSASTPGASTPRASSTARSSSSTARRACATTSWSLDKGDDDGREKLRAARDRAAASHARLAGGAARARRALPLRAQVEGDSARDGRARVDRPSRLRPVRLPARDRARRGRARLGRRRQGVRRYAGRLLRFQPGPRASRRLGGCALASGEARPLLRPPERAARAAGGAAGAAGAGPEHCAEACVDFVRRMLRGKETPFGDARAVSNVAAVLVEPMQASAGYVIPGEGYLRGLRELCNEFGFLLIDDEIQAGMGRTGRLWACEWDGVAPDLMAVSKGLASGLPISAVVGSDEVLSSLGPGSHVATFAD